jgi:SAM-dependent methyltransferase
VPLTLVELVATGGYDTDKGPDYLIQYEEFLAPRREQVLRVLELGVLRGGSLRLWRDYFPNAIVVGLDAEPVVLLDETGRVRLYQGRQEDTRLLDRIGREVAPKGFDLIVDDASHMAAPTRESFWHLFVHHLRSGGLYAIEDWGTGYWESWADGHRYARDHCHGMVGFVKELVDECGMADITHPERGLPPQRASRFQKVHVSGGLVLVVKASG